MTLTQQLEDKKKGCGCSLRIVDLGQGKEIFICNSKELCKTCKSNIAILEQAIAEIKKRDKDIDELAESSTFALCALMKENKELKDEMQKQRQEILDLIDKIEPEIKKDLENPDLKRDEKGIVSGTCHLIKLKIIQQLNQPKTEEWD